MTFIVLNIQIQNVFVIVIFIGICRSVMDLYCIVYTLLKKYSIAFHRQLNSLHNMKKKERKIEKHYVT